MRVFAGMPLPHTARQVIADWIAVWRKADRTLKWIRPETMHVTIHFFGEIDPESARAIGEVLGRVRARKIPATLGGVSRFPSRGNPRVFYVDFDEGAREIFEVRKSFTEAIRFLGFRTESRRFTPHVTVARVRDGKTAAEPPDFGTRLGTECVLDRLVLYESILGPTGAEYRPIATTLLW